MDSVDKRIKKSYFWKIYLESIEFEKWLLMALNLSSIGCFLKNGKYPTKFICLVIKLHEFKPSFSMIKEFIKNDSNLIIRLLGAFYIRLYYRPLLIYKLLEPLYYDYRRVPVQIDHSKTKMICVDIIIDSLLNKTYVMGIKLNSLVKRNIFEKHKLLSTNYLK